MLTAIDQIANQNHLQLIKAVLPYLPSGNQRSISLLIKLLELQNVSSFYRSPSACVSACSHSDSPALTEVLSDIRTYCDESDQELIDSVLQILNTLELYSAMMQELEPQE